MKDWLVPVIVAVLSGGLLPGIGMLVKSYRSRGRERVDAVAELSKTSHEWVERFEAKATQALDESARAHGELVRVRREATALADELHSLRLAILAPTATIDGLRDLVRRGGGPSTNGRPS